MKNSILLALFLASISNIPLAAQQRFQQTQTLVNHFVNNPAATGYFENTDIKVGFRKQWLGITDGPFTGIASIQGRISNSSASGTGKALSTRTRMYAMSKSRQVVASTKPKGFHGIGGYAVFDRTGPTGTTAGYFNYAYHIPIQGQTFLSLGASVGLLQYRLDPSKLNYVDNGLGTGTTSDPNLDISVGAMLYGKSGFIGYAAHQLLQNKLDLFQNSSAIQPTLALSHSISGGLNFAISPLVSLVPFATARLIGGAPASVDGGLRVNYKDFLWIGGSYRNEDAISGMLGVRLSDALNFSYSYDYTTSSLKAASNGSHELILGLRFGQIKNDSQTKLFW